MSKEIEEDVKKVLSEGEEVLFVANQSRVMPGGSLTTPDSIYITNRRVIWRNPRMFGLKKDYIDVDYRDISNIRMKKGLLSTEIFLKSRFLSDEISLPAIDKQDAEQANMMIRMGINRELLGQAITRERISPTVKAAEEEDPMEQLERLGRLRASGVITEEEFQAKKKELLGKI